MIDAHLGAKDLSPNTVHLTEDPTTVIFGE